MTKRRSNPLPSKKASGFFQEDLTPSHLRCSIGACPTVLQAIDGDLVVIGKVLSPELLAELGDKVGQDEFAIKIKLEYFSEIPKLFLKR